MVIATSPASSTSFSHFAPDPFSAGELLAPEQAEVLLCDLRQNRWQRLSVVYDDPIGMLFNNQARQWTLGWNEHQDELYLLVWETESWQGQALWSLYCNGVLVYQEADGAAKRRNTLCQELLESPLLPCISTVGLFTPLVDFRYGPEQREAATHNLIQTLLSRPAVFEALKAPLMEALNAELDSTDWPVLDILKLHRAAHKLALLSVLDTGLKQGWLHQPSDLEQLNQSLHKLMTLIEALQGQLSLLFQPGLTQTRQALLRLCQQPHWRVVMQPLETLCV